MAFALAVFTPAQTGPCNRTSGKELSRQTQNQFASFVKSGADTAAVCFDMALHYAKLHNYGKAMYTLELALKDTPWLDPFSEPD